MNQMELLIGLDAISSYRRLAYTPWHAIAEFVDNSTQAYFDNINILNKEFEKEKTKTLLVAITYDRDDEILRVVDNSIGMSYEDLTRAMHVGLRPVNTSGRSKYGMGLKTAACWIGNKWTIRTKKLGEELEHKIEVDVKEIANGNADLHYNSKSGRPIRDHYTIIEIFDHNRKFQGRTLFKIKDYLRSMYREDFRNETLILEWQGERLSWQEPEMLVAPDGTFYKKDFQFRIDQKEVKGWVGILERGSRADAGFSIIHSGRVVKGWPDSWRPSSLFGQIQGSNDLINQRLVGEIHLDSFEISHTKDDILWLGSQEEDIEKKLLETCGDYKEYAKIPKKKRDEGRGPTEIEITAAIEEIREELESSEMVDKIELINIPPKEVIEMTKNKLLEDVKESREESFIANVGTLIVKVYIEDLSISDPYVLVESTMNSEVLAIINSMHPHWILLKESEGVANYLRHCVYDGIAEWNARKKTSDIDPDTIKMFKDQLLRVSFEIEKHDRKGLEINKNTTL